MGDATVPQRLQHRHPVHLGHVEVEQRHVGRLVGHETDGVSARPGQPAHADAVRKPTEHPLVRTQRCGLVVDEDDP